jgi:murein DD-endopeptidase MepM/ murein hydrolase activator NlpD
MDIPFGGPTTYPGHSGVDFPEPAGTTIKASGPGRIRFVGWLNSNAGYSTIVDYDNGPSVLYCHQPEKAWRPAIGSRVDYGWAIGSVGSTGRSTGPHLHLEIMVGEGAHTYEGVWNYFDRNRVISSGNAASSGAVTLPKTENGEIDMFVAMCPNGWFLIVPQGGGKPKAVVLDRDAGSENTNIPRIKFSTANSLAMLNAAVQF